MEHTRITCRIIFSSFDSTALTSMTCNLHVLMHVCILLMIDYLDDLCSFSSKSQEIDPLPSCSLSIANKFLEDRSSFYSIYNIIVIIFLLHNYRKKQNQLVSYATRDWQICLGFVVKMMRDYLWLNLCPMKHLQNIFFTVRLHA